MFNLKTNHVLIALTCLFLAVSFCSCATKGNHTETMAYAIDFQEEPEDTTVPIDVINETFYGMNFIHGEEYRTSRTDNSMTIVLKDYESNIIINVTELPEGETQSAIDEYGIDILYMLLSSNIKSFADNFETKDFEEFNTVIGGLPAQSSAFQLKVDGSWHTMSYSAVVHNDILYSIMFNFLTENESSDYSKEFDRMLESICFD